MKIKKFENYFINEAFDADQRERIINEFFNRLYKSTSVTIWQKLGGTYRMDHLKNSLKPILRRQLEEMDENENTRNFAIRFMRIFRSKMMYPSIVQALGGTYLIDPYFKKWRIILTNILNRELGNNVNESVVVKPRLMQCNNCDEKFPEYSDFLYIKRKKCPYCKSTDIQFALKPNIAPAPLRMRREEQEEDEIIFR